MVVPVRREARGWGQRSCLKLLPVMVVVVGGHLLGPGPAVTGAVLGVGIGPAVPWGDLRVFTSGSWLRHLIS
jgi:hypothetical protein